MKKERVNSRKIEPAALSVKKLQEILSSEYLNDEEIELLCKDPRKGVHELLLAYRRRIRTGDAERERIHRMSLRERELQEQGHSLVAGIDEAGRGPLAGPVVAAAVILDWRKESLWEGLDDSKKLTASARERLFTVLAAEATAIAVGVVDHALIDRINIYQASLEAMRLAVRQLHPQPHYLLCDGFSLPGMDIPQEGIRGGDASCLCIAAASIVAKVMRDHIMNGFAALYPGYGFDQHKGYATSYHHVMLQVLGPSPLHRHSFRWGI
ncbi:MAG: ribonuclease HII [Bacillota bacterium]